MKFIHHNPHTGKKQTCRPRTSIIFINSDADKTLVIKTFNEAESKGYSTPDCYIFAAEAWNRRHPESSYEYAARQAVQILLEVRTQVLMGGLQP
jgi:hypothetical protein